MDAVILVGEVRTVSCYRLEDVHALPEFKGPGITRVLGKTKAALTKCPRLVHAKITWEATTISKGARHGRVRDWPSSTGNDVVSLQQGSCQV